MTRVHRPYADGPVPSITTVLGALNVDALKWAAARETAIRAITRPDAYAGMTQPEAINALARHFDVMWGGARDMGTLVHTVNECWCSGEEADLERLVGEVPAWQGREEVVIADANRYIDGLERFWEDLAPETLTTETIVRYCRGDKPMYVGTTDWVVAIGGRKLLVEIKTSSKVEKKPGARLWLDHWRLQLAAQRHATHIVTYDDEGNEKSSRPNDITVDGCAVLHLCGDRDYGFWEVRAAGDEHGHFMRLLDIYHWWNKGHKTPAPVDLKAQLLAKAAA